MHKFALVVIVVALCSLPAAAAEPELPKMPAPQKEHQWLERFVGEWESEAEMIAGPGQPAEKCHGIEKTRSLGGFWIVAENNAKFHDTPINAILTLGYDADKKKYVGTWIDSVTSYLWKYEGAVDSTGTVLTLETEGPNPTLQGKLSKFKDVTEFKTNDHKVLTSSMMGDDGKWVTFATINYRRKK